MFSQFTTITYTPGNTATETDNTDYQYSGSAKQFTFPAIDDFIDIDFDPIDISTWDEITMQLSVHTQFLTTNNVFKITINAVDYNFTKSDFQNNKYTHITFDASGLTALSQIKITGLSANLVIFMDLLGYRKVDFATVDTDITDALANKISLDYNFSTTLAAAVTAASDTISLTSDDYIFENTQLEISDGANTETVFVLDDATTIDQFSFSHAIGTTVNAQCPTKTDENALIVEPDPVCAITITDRGSENIEYYAKDKKASKKKMYVSNLGVTVYIECTSKSKVLELSSQYNSTYGKEFQFILDGEIVDIYQNGEPVFVDKIIGNKPRIAYNYRIMPQPVTKRRRGLNTTTTLTMEPKSWN